MAIVHQLVLLAVAFAAHPHQLQAAAESASDANADLRAAIAAADRGELSDAAVDPSSWIGAGLLGEANLPAFRAAWATAPLHAPAAHNATARVDTLAQSVFSSVHMHRVLAGPRAPETGYAQDGFDMPYAALLGMRAKRTGDEFKGNLAFEAYLAGGTVFVNFLSKHAPGVAALTCWLSKTLRIRTQTNAYLTPPDAQGFTAHTDSQDVFILQVRTAHGDSCRSASAHGRH